MEDRERVEALKLITHIMLRMGFHANQYGYRYLREAICQCMADPELLTSVTKLLYPTVAKIYGVDCKKIERAIRTSIETAWREEKWNIVDRVFGTDIDYHQKRPTNTDFIDGMIKYMSREKDYFEDIC